MVEQENLQLDILHDNNELDNVINVIIIEDDDEQLNLYADVIEENNKEDNQIIVNAIFMKNDDELDAYINNYRIDALIIDLNWGIEDKENKGNDVIERIHSHKRIPIIVISGNLNRLKKRRKHSDIYREYNRAEIDFYQVINEIKIIFDSGYTKVFGHPGEIDGLLNDVFWNYASNYLKTWCQASDIELRNRRFMRFITARMNEQLHYFNNIHDHYDTIEFYINPPNSDKFFNGDIVLFENDYYIVITPSCTIENNKSSIVTLCKISFDEFRILRKKVKETISNTTKNKINDLINNKDNEIHFLPPTLFFEGAIIKFCDTLEVELSKFEEFKIIKYRVSQIFMKDVINRYALFLRNSNIEKANYFSKQGQPSLELEEIIKLMKIEELSD